MVLVLIFELNLVVLNQVLLLHHLLLQHPLVLSLIMPPELDAELEKAPKDAEEGGDEAKELGSAPPSLVQKSKPKPSADAEDDDEEPIEQNLTKDKARARKEK
jgi:hypothetical protein